MSKEDDVFYREFGTILAALFVFFLIALFVARAIGANAFEAARLAPGEVEKRIAPIGQVAYGEAGTMAEPEVIEVAVAAEPMSGPEVYQQACSACHATGAAGAPRMGDTAEWGERAKQGLSTLVESALNGKGNMLPKAGRADLSDDEIISALHFMLDETGVTTN